MKCPHGTYSDTIDATSCTDCPEGQTTLKQESESVSQCMGKEIKFIVLIFPLLKQKINITIWRNKMLRFYQPDTCPVGEGWVPYACKPCQRGKSNVLLFSYKILLKQSCCEL